MKSHKEYPSQNIKFKSPVGGRGNTPPQLIVQKMDMEFPILFDRDGGVSSLYEIQAVPTTFLIDKQGIIIAKKTGPMTMAWMKRQLDYIR